ncbi:MAG TPA: EAL domain-containing protein [Burkholderiales bacterium]|jgi:EAL and modified HD-GYP domain-containing signal transduction protein
MAEQPAQELFLGRQPILDRSQNLAAFELLFRAGHFNGAQIEDDVFASATVINHAFSEMGMEAVLGKHPGFINLSAPLIMSDMIELLPRNKVVLEILETVRVTDALAQRCRALKQIGFTLALDDYTGREEVFKPLLDVVDIVKVDVQHMDEHALERTTASLKKLPVRLLAEKLDTRAQVERCLELGYDLFQGYYFARPSIITGKRLTRSETALMRLLGLLLSGADTPKIEKVFEHDPDLASNLMRLLNSAAIAGQIRIQSLRQAIAVLGRERLLRALHVLLFTLSSAPAAEFPSPLLLLAATRGRMMELIARALRPQDSAFHDRAFVAGILSLVNALLGMPMSEILGSMPVHAEVRAALVERSGNLGAMLSLVEALEEAELIGIERALDRVPGLEHGQVMGLQIEAMRWANSIGEPA